MKICLAQIEPCKGNIEENIKRHISWIEQAIAENADLIVFPELSLTGYEPELAQKLVIDISDKRLDPFQRLSDKHSLGIALGAPTQSELGIHISMIVFQPGIESVIYSKQILHADEKEYFQEGVNQMILTISNLRIAPAICFESLQAKHIEDAAKLGADLYLASVAKSQSGIEKAYAHYPIIAAAHSLTVAMVNNVGPCDNFIGAGLSAVWNTKGKLVKQLDNENESLLLFNTEGNE